MSKTESVTPDNLDHALERTLRAVKGYVDDQVNNAGGTSDTTCECSSDKGNSGFLLLEVEYDRESPWAYCPDAVILDGNGKPDKPVRIDYIPIPGLLPTGWDALKALTHEESLAHVARDAEAGLPTVAHLTFWEYRKLFPDGMTREEYLGAKIWAFEYNGTEWLPTEMIPNTGETDESGE